MERKRIGILTFHVAHNYGAMLQAYALPIKLIEMGYDCEIIDYRFSYIYAWSIVENRQELIKKYGVVFGTLRWLKRYIKGVYSPKRKINKFNEFRENYIIHSSKIYFDKESLNNMDYDFIIFGSDQIWNDELTNGLATEFFGDFTCLSKTKKLAYAASCGKNDFSRKYKKKYLELLKDYVALGVREEGLEATLKKEGFQAMRVLDPTFLIDKSKWDLMIQKDKSNSWCISKEYLLVYVFDEDEELYTFVDKIAEEKRLEVVIIAYEKKEITKNYRVLNECGPLEFVRLIANSRMVITTSFHGTVFSILYHKEFYCIPHCKYHERTDSLLKMLDLEDRNINQYNKSDKVKIIDWENIDKIIERERNKSIEFLRESIEEER